MNNDAHSSRTSTSKDFIALPTHIGDTLQLQSLAANHQRYSAKLLGYLNKHSLLLSQPLLDEHAITVAAGEDFLVRGFCGATTYEFNAKVLLVCSQPYSYLHLSFPEQVTSLEMRGAVRIKVKLACSVANTLNHLKMPATICDLSTSGVRLQSSANLGQVGATLQVHFNLAIEHEAHPFTLTAIIRNVAIADNDHLGTYGVEFVNLGGADSIALQSCIYILLIDKRTEE